MKYQSTKILFTVYCGLGYNSRFKPLRVKILKNPTKKIAWMLHGMMKRTLEYLKANLSS